MAEETEKKGQENPTGETFYLIDKANAAAERLEKANKQHEELLARQEAMEAKRALGGRSEAGSAPVVPHVETPKEYKDRIMKGG